MQRTPFLRSVDVGNKAARSLVYYEIYTYIDASFVLYHYIERSLLL